MCDFQIDYRFFNSKSSTIKTEKKMKMKCDFNMLKCSMLNNGIFGRINEKC